MARGAQTPAAQSRWASLMTFLYPRLNRQWTPPSSCSRKVFRPLEVTESVTPFNVNYMIEPAVAMSGLFKLNDRIPADHGVVKAIEENDRGYYVTVTFEYE